MNHLRAIQEAIAANEVLAFEQHHDGQHYLDALASVRRISEHAMCFDLGDVDMPELLKVRQVAGVFQLPYPVTWFEFNPFRTGPRESVCAMAVQQDGGPIHCLVFGGSNAAGWAYAGTAFSIDLCEPSWMCQVPNAVYASGHPANHLLKAAVLALCQLTRCLSCSNVERVEVHPDAALQRARQRRGKPPLFSFWTLHVRPSSKHSLRAHGDASAAPGVRAHLVRGHAQRYGRDRTWQWKQPYAKGRTSLGLVHKDYSVRPRNPHQPSAGA